MSSKLQPDFLSNFFTSLIKIQSSKSVDNFNSRDEF
jgi:hypothetical protein